jgi:transcriptional regulator with XRE-family HTH domain
MPTFHRKAFKKISEDAGDTSTRMIAARTGLDKAQVARLLNGSRQPHFDTAAIIAEAYGVSLDVLKTSDKAA